MCQASEKSRGSKDRKLGLVRQMFIAECRDIVQFPCGCVAGRYVTFGGTILTVIDWRAPDCQNESHAVNTIVWECEPGQTPGH